MTCMITQQAITTIKAELFFFLANLPRRLALQWRKNSLYLFQASYCKHSAELWHSNNGFCESLMALLMGCHKSLGDKPLPTKLTLVGSLSSVVPHVNDQGRALGKWLTTFITLMGFLPSMWTHMILHVVAGTKCFRTYITNKWFFASMNSTMNF